MSNWRLPPVAGSTSTVSPRRPGTPSWQLGSDQHPRPRRSVEVGVRMMVCTRTFSTMHDRELLSLRAGMDRVLSTHPIVRAHPDKFKPAQTISKIAGGRSDGDPRRLSVR